MNHDQATALFDDLGERVDSRPPMAELFTAGRQAERRRRRGLLAATVAAVVLLAGGVAVAQQALVGGEGRPAPNGVADVPTAPAGMRLVGMGRVVVSVPESWGTQEVHCSGQPSSDTVFFASGRVCLADFSQRGIASVGFFSLRSDVGKIASEYAGESIEINGLAVRRKVSPPKCPDTARCLEPPWSQVMVVPDEEVVIVVPAAGEDAGVLDTVQLLPEGFTTVPWIVPDTPSGPAGNQLLAAGFEVEKAWEVEGDFVGSGRIPVRIASPTPGSVVAEGSTVVLERTDRTDPERGPVPDLDGEWTLALSGITGGAELDDQHRDATITITFVDGRMGANDGCNRLGADYQHEGHDLEFGPIESTHVGCDITPDLVTVLNDVRHVTTSDGVVHLHADHWGIVASLRPVALQTEPAMLVSPSSARPGQILELTFPGAPIRGIGYTFVAEDGGARYALTIGDTYLGPEPSWVEGEGGGWRSVGRAGSGPDIVVVPDVAAAGTYELCTANAKEQMCASVVVLPRGSTSAEGTPVTDLADVVGEWHPIGSDSVLEITAWKQGYSQGYQVDCNSATSKIQLDERDTLRVTGRTITEMGCGDAVYPSPAPLLDGHRLALTDDGHLLAITPDGEIATEYEGA